MAKAPPPPVRVPAASLKWIDRQVDLGLFPSREKVVDHLVRKARAEETQSAFEALVIEGLESGPSVPLTRSLLDRVRKRGDAKLARAAERASGRRVTRRKSA